MPHPVSRYSVREHPDFLPIVCRGVCDGGASWSGKALRAPGKISREWTRMNGAGEAGKPASYDYLSEDGEKMGGVSFPRWRA